MKRIEPTYLITLSPTQLFQKRKKYFTPHFFSLVKNISVNNIIINTMNDANATGINDYNTLLYNSIIII